MPQLQAVSYLAPNLFWFYESITQALSQALAQPIELTQSPFDALDDPAWRADAVDLAFVCGLPFARWQRLRPEQFTPLAAPVMTEPRYQDRPRYFADVIVRATSAVRDFADLRGKTLCYNDFGSNSGYNLLRSYLIEAELTDGFFGQVTAAGSHLKSIQQVLDEQADCAAIDSVVLEQAMRDNPSLATELHVCQVLGPSPMPPILTASRLGTAAVAQMHAALRQPSSALETAMMRAQVRRFAPMETADYAVLAAMYDRAFAVGFGTIR